MRTLLKGLLGATVLASSFASAAEPSIQDGDSVCSFDKGKNTATLYHCQKGAGNEIACAPDQLSRQLNRTPDFMERLSLAKKAWQQFGFGALSKTNEPIKASSEEFGEYDSDSLLILEGGKEIGSPNAFRYIHGREGDSCQIIDMTTGDPIEEGPVLNEWSIPKTKSGFYGLSPWVPN